MIIGQWASVPIFMDAKPSVGNICIYQDTSDVMPYAQESSVTAIESFFYRIKVI